MNRIDRLSAIINYLQGRQKVTVEDFSERYNISERTVYRDLAALQEAGISNGSEPGELIPGRELLYDLFLAIAKNKKPNNSDQKQFNALLGKVMSQFELHMTDGLKARLQWKTKPPCTESAGFLPKASVEKTLLWDQ